MGSRITRPIYQAERNAQPTSHSIIEFIRYFSILLSLFSLFTIGYARQIDRQLIRIMSPHYQLQPWFSTLEAVIGVVSPIFFGLLLSMFSHVVVLMRCSLLFLLSQVLSYMSFERLGIEALYIGEVVLDIYSVGILMCILCMLLKQAPSALEYFLSGVIALAALNIGSHWSNLLTVSAHSTSIQSVYLNSTIFSALASMSSFIIVQMQKKLRHPKKNSYELDRRNWNFETLWLIGKIHVRTFQKVHLKNQGLVLISGFLVGMLQERLTAGEEAHLVPNILLWAVIAVATIAISRLDNERVLAGMFPLLMVILAIAGLITGNMQLFALAAYHCSEIANIMSLGQLNSLIFYVIQYTIQSISLGFYYAAYSLGIAAQSQLLASLPELALVGVCASLTAATTLHALFWNKQQASQKPQDEESPRLVTSPAP